MLEFALGLFNFSRILAVAVDLEIRMEAKVTSQFVSCQGGQDLAIKPLKTQILEEREKLEDAIHQGKN
jgi:hypothetical protein